MMMIENKKIGLYIHIPFCRRKCAYCDFYSLTKTEELENNYLRALENEIESYRDDFKDYLVDTIFIGGGTPSFMAVDNLKDIIHKLHDVFKIEEDAEITIESNPDSLDFEKANAYKEMGINRISIGVQSLDDEVLKTIGRLHDSSKAIKAIEEVIKAGYDNINVDLMFNIPKQSKKSIEKTLEKLISMKIQHISFYSLILEEKTKLYEDVEKGLLQISDDINDREQYYLGRDLMKKAGFNQYEISNFAKKGYECKHNMRYWLGLEYIGFGPFAHSFIDNKRYHNLPDIKKYIEVNNSGTCLPSSYREVDENLSTDDKLFEYIMLRLRMIEGFALKDINQKFNIDFELFFKEEIDKLIKEDLLIMDKNYVKLSDRGLDLSNQVFCEFMEKIYKED